MANPIHSGPSLTVRYWKRMRPNKVYPVVVTCSGAGDAAPVTVRLVMAGAQVVPAEQALDLTHLGAKVTFYVTPIAKGHLRAERIEVLDEGKKIRELRIPCKVCTQRPTLLWLFLAFFIPWLLLHFFVYSPIGYKTPLYGNGTEQYVRKPSDEYAQEHLDRVPQAKRISEFVQDNTPNLEPLVGKGDVLNAYEDVQTFPERTYVHLLRGYRAFGQPIAFYVFVFFLLLALYSFITRQESARNLRF